MKLVKFTFEPESGFKGGWALVPAHAIASIEAEGAKRSIVRFTTESGLGARIVGMPPAVIGRLLEGKGPGDNKEEPA